MEVERAVIRIEQIGAAPGGAKATLDEPLDHLLACHRRIEERLEILERAAGHLEDRREEALEAIGKCFHFLETNGAWHTADEEESVFPRMRYRTGAENAEFLRRLEADHRDVESTYAAVKDRYGALSSDNPAHARDAMAGFREEVLRVCGQYRAHIQAEDSRLIGMARAALGDADLAAISSEMKARRGLSG